MQVNVTCQRCGKYAVVSYQSGVTRKFCSLLCANRGRPQPPLEPRFWARVDKTGECWLWTGSRQRYGYGQVSIGKKKLALAHRVAWEFTNGPIPDGLEVCHNCPGGDNPSCVRPSHMFLGTHTDNMRDWSAKGMHWANKRGDVTPALVIEMRRMFASGGFTKRQIAANFGLHESRVGRILNGQVWTHVS